MAWFSFVSSVLPYCLVSSLILNNRHKHRLSADVIESLKMFLECFFSVVEAVQQRIEEEHIELPHSTGLLREEH